MTGARCIPSTVLAVAAFAGCMTGGVITDLSSGSETRRVFIQGRERPLFLGDERLYVRFVNGEDLGGFSAGVYVDPGEHCVVAELNQSGRFSPGDGWTEPLCFEAVAGHVYRLGYGAGRYHIVDDGDGTVVARAGRANEAPTP